MGFNRSAAPRTSPPPDDARPAEGEKHRCRRARPQAPAEQGPASSSLRRSSCAGRGRRARVNVRRAALAAGPRAHRLVAGRRLRALARCSSGCSARPTRSSGPVVAGTIVATVAMPVVSALARHMPRAAAAVLVLLALAAIAVAVVVVVIGGITAQRDSISEHASAGSDKAAGWLNDLGVDESGSSSANVEREARRPADDLDARQGRDQRHQRADVARLRPLFHAAQPLLPAEGRALDATLGRPSPRRAATGRDRDHRRPDPLTPRLLPRRHAGRGLQRRRGRHRRADPRSSPRRHDRGRHLHHGLRAVHRGLRGRRASRS